MRQERRFARVRPNASAGSLIVGPKLPVVSCNVVDYSAGGACVELNSDISLPSRFELLHGGTKKKCRMVWKRDRRVGVAF
ncbi:PilZ domain-containing protein [Rhodopseudomonas palustris]|jgi:PilZ domain|uniref:PilZ domain-containing protein n=1 Tax=Rhodopseudomonas TaxID=1073 RepID=UPI0006B98085|nr:MULTISPECIES: PilZ domain-containing protein [Rhodopseudomonas]KPF97720.1 pilus assembly protein PilZ [Rhodopseudomonas sp. AAP120]MCP9626813.1 PilZ domain-containing protein [Rhodopseudomonas palustris]